jgi:hypothetical protein
VQKRGLAPATIYCRLSFLSSFYEWLRRDPDLGRHVRKYPVTLVLYVCHRLNADKEMACDEQVISSVFQAELYAESILKAAELDIAMGGTYRLAFFSARQILERRSALVIRP